MVTLDTLGVVDRISDVAAPEILAEIRQGGFDAVVHQAGISNTLESDEALLHEYNTAKPLTIAEACSESATPFIYASSFSVYGSTGRRPVRETDIATTSGPLNPYARSKLRLDDEMASRFPGGNWMGLRYTNVFGPHEPTEGRMSSVISQWLRRSAQGEPIQIFEGTEESGRDFVEVDRIARVVLRRLEDNGPAGARGVFNLGSGVTVKFRELIDWCSNFAGSQVEVRTIPFTIAGQYQHWTSVDMGALGCHYPDLVVTGHDLLRSYAHQCWRSHLRRDQQRD